MPPLRSKPVDVDRQFGIGFKKAREAAGLTQNQVMTEMAGRGFGFYTATVFKIENNQRRVSVAEALALAEIVKVPVEGIVALGTDGLPAARAGLQAEVRDWAYAVQSAIRAAGAIRVIENHSLPEQLDRMRDEGGDADLEEFLAPVLNSQVGFETQLQLARSLLDLPDDVLAIMGVGTRHILDIPADVWAAWSDGDGEHPEAS